MSVEVGFIGVGVMGSNMAKRLLSKYTLWVYDVDSSRVEALVKFGARAVSSVGEMAGKVSTVFLSLPEPRISENVCQLLIENSVRHLVIVDTSTIDPATSDNIYSLVSSRGHDYLTAPVIGGEAGAANGTLTILVGGNAEAFNNVKELLKILGTNIIYVGRNSEASVIKLINNLMSLANTLVFVEALTLGLKFGVPAQKVYDTLKGASGMSEAFRRRWINNISKANFEPGYSVKLALKDLRLIKKLANFAETSLITPYLMDVVYSQLPEELKSKDVSVLYPFYLKKHGLGGIRSEG